MMKPRRELGLQRNERGARLGGAGELCVGREDLAAGIVFDADVRARRDDVLGARRETPMRDADLGGALHRSARWLYLKLRRSFERPRDERLHESCIELGVRRREDPTRAGGITAMMIDLEDGTAARDAVRIDDVCKRASDRVARPGRSMLVGHVLLRREAKG